MRSRLTAIGDQLAIEIVDAVGEVPCIQLDAAQVDRRALDRTVTQQDLYDLQRVEIGRGYGLPLQSQCPSSDDLRQIVGFREGGSGSLVVEIMRRVVGAASDDLRLSGV